MAAMFVAMCALGVGVRLIFAGPSFSAPVIVVVLLVALVVALLSTRLEQDDG